MTSDPKFVKVTRGRDIFTRMLKGAGVLLVIGWHVVLFYFLYILVSFVVFEYLPFLLLVPVVCWAAGFLYEKACAQFGQQSTERNHD